MLQKMEYTLQKIEMYITEKQDTQCIQWRYTFDEIKYCTCP